MLTQEQIAEMRRVARGHNEGTDLSEAAAMAAAVCGHIKELERECYALRNALLIGHNSACVPVERRLVGERSENCQACRTLGGGKEPA